MNKNKISIKEKKKNLLNSLNDIEKFLTNICKIDKFSKLYKILKK